MQARCDDEAQRFSFEAFTRHPFFTEVNRWIVERVICPGRRKIVDLGCGPGAVTKLIVERLGEDADNAEVIGIDPSRSEEHTSELQSLAYLVCRLLLEKKKRNRQGARADNRLTLRNT